MQFYLMDIAKNHLLAKVFEARIEIGEVDSSDCMDEMFRQIQKKQNDEILAGHADVHRVLKDLVAHDSEKGNLSFTKKLSQALLKNLDAVLQSRACWILIKMLELDNTKKLVLSDLKKQE